MNIDKYLYEIIDDYKHAESEREKTEIFNDFCQSLWSCKNKRRTYMKTIRFKVRNDLLQTEIGQIFNTWSEVEYKGYKATTQDADWCNIIRQKINNLYTRYFDDEVILNRDYMELLKTSKTLYYRWIDGDVFDAEELTSILENAFYKAEELKSTYKKQKIKLSWSEYKDIIEGFLLKMFNNCQLIEDYENGNKLVTIYDFFTEDNFYVKYICNSLEGEMLKWQKKKHKVRDHQKYKHCKECGVLIEKTGRNTQYCIKCKEIKRKETKRNWWNKNH